MARTVRQALPQPPPAYDQAYLAQLADAINYYIFQREAPGELVAARFIMVDPVIVPGDLSDTKTLATGTEYLASPFQAADDSALHQSWATATLTLTTASQAIPGCSYTLLHDGRYLLMATYDFTVVGNEQGATLYGGVTGSSHLAFVETSSKSGRNSASLQGIFQGTTGQVVSLTAYKSGGGGTSFTGTECSLTVLWVGAMPVLQTNFLTVVTPQDV